MHRALAIVALGHLGHRRRACGATGSIAGLDRCLANDRRRDSPGRTRMVASVAAERGGLSVEYRPTIGTNRQMQGATSRAGRRRVTQPTAECPAATGWRTCWPNRRSLLPLLGIAAGARLVSVLATQRGPLSSDPAAYFEQAVAIANLSADKPFYWPPGTSIMFVPWIAVGGDSTATARVGAAVYGLLLVPAVMFLAGAVFRDRRVALVSGWCIALYPPAVLMAGDPQSHVLAGLLVCLLLGSIIHAAETGRIAWWAASGASLGCLAITRPATLLLVLLPLSLPLLRRRSRAPDGRSSSPVSIRGLIVLMTICVAVMAPVALHNVRSGSELTLATNDQVNLFFGNNPYTPLYWTSDIASGHKSAEFNEYRASIDGGSDTALRAAAIDHIVDHPVEFALRSANRARAFWGFDYYRTAELRSTGWPAPAVLAVLMLEAGGYIAAAFLALAGFVGPLKTTRTWKRDLLVLAVALMFVPYIFSFSVGIYHFAVIVLLMPVIAAVLCRMAAEGVRSSLRSALGSWQLLIGAMIIGLLQVEYAYWLVRYS